MATLASVFNAQQRHECSMAFLGSQLVGVHTGPVDSNTAVMSVSHTLMVYVYCDCVCESAILHATVAMTMTCRQME